MDLLDLKGIGPKKKELLNKLDINSISDLYNYYPNSFEDRRNRSICSKANIGVKHYFQWIITSKAKQIRTKNGLITYLYAKEENSSDKIKIIWFNDRFSANKLIVGRTYKFYTKIDYENGIYVAYNPTFAELNDDSIGSIIPIYGLTAGLNQKNISNFIRQALNYYDKNEEIFNKSLLERFNLESKYDNLLEVHKPTNKEKLLKAKSQLKILDFTKELIFLDCINRKYNYKDEINLKYNLDEILEKIPFELTRSQLIALKEILEDASDSKLMNRLLIGDVGSGKTIIAIIVMIVFAINSYQSAMMVPTEVLAIQQFEKNREFVESFGLKLGLLTGSSKNKDQVKNDLIDGKIDIVIGTHALIQDDVKFKNLKLVINDEQQRFGVFQRQDLALKAKKVNYLSMTATPIPRTLSLKIAKILDLSMITELPKGRKPINTKVINIALEKLLVEKLKENIKACRQIYIVTNNINSDDNNSLENLYKRYKDYFQNFTVKKLHGEMKAADKEKTLKDFSDGKIDVLISTTVIEVGIDVKNANTMVIYNAINFGLSTLHQLRGRVGRGTYDSFCYLVSNNSNKNSKLNILVNSQDGFEIARKDYDLRGGGKILSSIQHGRNLEQIEYLTMAKKEIDKSFEILDFTKKTNYDNVNLSEIEKFFDEDKRIILN